MDWRNPEHIAQLAHELRTSGNPTEAIATAMGLLADFAIAQQTAATQAEVAAVNAQQAQSAVNHSLALAAAAAATQPANAAGNSGGIRPAKPEVFYGNTKDRHNVVRWIYAMTIFFEASGEMDNERRIRFANAHLRGAAMDWLKALGDNVPDTWDLYGASLIQAFQPINSDEAYREQFYSMEQTKDLYTYNHQFRELLLKLNPQPQQKDVVLTYFKGLKPQVRKLAKLTVCTTIDEAMQSAERVEAASGNLPSQRRPYGFYNQSAGPTPMDVSAAGRRSGPTSRSRNFNSNVKPKTPCPRCKQPGHWARECPNQSTN